MKKDIILAGVGGQGILSVAAIIGLAALDYGLEIKQSEVHGMSQRGGAVVSHLRISDKQIFSDLIPEGNADMILAVEPMEALRYLGFLKKEGWIITNSKPFINVPDYPPPEKLLNEIKSLPNSIIIDADEIAKRLKSPRSSNIVMVGAASPYLGIPLENIEKGIRQIFERKGEEVVQLNISALYAGREVTLNYEN